jgi:hypothetical protein
MYYYYHAFNNPQADCLSFLITVNSPLSSIFGECGIPNAWENLLRHPVFTQFPPFSSLLILSYDRVIIDEVWISNWIYCTFIQLVTSINYIVIANSHTLLLTMAHTKSSVSSLGVAWQQIPTMFSASVFHGSSPCWLVPVSQLSLQSSLKGYSSCPCGSQTTLPNRWLKIVLLCPWPPACRPTASKLPTLN